MAKKCPITGKTVLVGNNVSHANNKNKRRFLPNLQKTSLLSESLGRMVKLRLSTNGLRTIEFHGGLDAFLLKTSGSKLSPKVARLKRAIEEKNQTRQ